MTPESKKSHERDSSQGSEDVKSSVPDFGNSIKIVHSRSSSESTEQMPNNGVEGYKQISYASVSGNSEFILQKENTQPNQVIAFLINFRLRKK